MTAAAALQEGVATPATPVVVPDRLARADQSFKDSHEHGIERLTFAVFPVIGYSITSDKRDMTTLHDIGQYTIRPQLARLPIFIHNLNFEPQDIGEA